MTIDFALQIARGETYIQTVDEIDYEREAKDVIFNAIREGALCVNGVIWEDFTRIHKLYLCDGKKCGEGHDCGPCHLTKDIKHAKTGGFNSELKLDFTWKSNKPLWHLCLPENVKVERADDDIFLIEQEVQE